MPCWRDASVPVRTSAAIMSAVQLCEVHTFCPLTTYSSPSRTARVRSDGRSDPAPGSE